MALLPAGADGGRKIAGAALFPGPSGRFAAKGDTGTLDLFEGSRQVASLGQFTRAAFDAKGNVLAWGSDEWAAFSASGGKVRGDPFHRSKAALLPSGILVQKTSGSITSLVELPASELFSAGYDCQHFFPGAGRMLCFGVGIGAHERRTLSLHVMSLATGEDLGGTPAPGALADLPIYAFSADGKRLVWSFEDVVMLDVASGKRTVLHRGRVPPLPNSSAARVAIATDQKHVCVAGEGGVHIVPPLSLRPNTAAACLFAPRRGAEWASAGLAAAGEWDGVIMTFPVTPGFVPIPAKPMYGVEIQSEAISRDGRTAAVMERSRDDRRPFPKKVTFQALVLDVATGAVRRTIHLADYLESFRREDSMELTLSDDGKILTLCAPAFFAGPRPCLALDAETGAQVPLPPPADNDSKPPGTLPQKWSDPAAAAALAAIGAAPAKDSRRVLSFHDEGAYVSVDIGTDSGVELHVNVPDAAERTVTDVAAAPDGSFVAVAGAGAVDLWSVQPLAQRASLIPAGPAAWAALFPDGTYELFGDGARAAVACEREGTLFPAAACSAKERPAGALRALISSGSTTSCSRTPCRRTSP